MTRKEASEKRIAITDALISEAEYIAQLDPFTAASVWQEHIGVMVSGAENLRRSTKLSTAERLQ